LFALDYLPKYVAIGGIKTSFVVAKASVTTGKGIRHDMEQECFTNITRIGIVVSTTPLTRPTGQNGQPMIVVPLSFLRIRQAFVGLLHATKFVGGRVVAVIFIGVILEGQFAMRFLDRGSVGVVRHTEHVVVTTDCVGGCGGGLIVAAHDTIGSSISQCLL